MEREVEREVAREVEAKRRSALGESRGGGGMRRMGEAGGVSRTV